MVLFDVISPEKGDEVAKQMSSSDALYVKVDITDSDAVKAAVKKAVDTFGNLVGCVHCAGIAVKRPWSNNVADSIPDFEKMLSVNTTGVSTRLIGAKIWLNQAFSAA